MKKTIQTLIAVIITILSVLTVSPLTSLAVPDSDIPKEMLDNPYLKALAYTGYKVDAQKSDGSIFKKYAYKATAYDSSIGYDSSFVTNGTETVSGSSKTGKVPDIARFKGTGLCCAAYVSYVYFNYLPNIAGVDVSKFARPDNYKSSTSYHTAAEKWVSSGAAKRISFNQKSDGTFSSENIPIGSLVIFKQNGAYSHVALYAGYYNGKHFVTHTGNSRGPEIETIEEMEKNGGMEFVSNIYSPPPEEPPKCRLTVQKTDGHGTPLSGAEFKVQEAVFAADGSYTWRDKRTLNAGTTNGSPRYFATDLWYTDDNRGWFRLVETKAPTGFKKDPTFKINAQSSDGEYEKTHMFTDGRFHFDPAAGAPDNFLFYYVVEDPPLKCKVTVAKRDANTHKFLEGAAFKVQEAAFTADGSYTWKDLINMTEERRTDGTVRYAAYNLAWSLTNHGWFKVVETKAPNGYKLQPAFTANDQTPNVNYDNEYRESDGAFKFDPTAGATDGFSFYYSADDPVDLGSCKIIKTSDDGNVEGIQFTVTGDGYNNTVTTGKDGTFTLTELAPGTYTVTENVPAGYKCTSTNPQTVTVKAGETATVNFENNLIYGNIELTKVDEEYLDNKLTGAAFTVTIVKDGKTTTQKMTEVSEGVYRLAHIPYNSVCTIKGTKAPEGFVLSNETFKVTIKEEKTYTVSSANFDAVVNTPIKGSLKIIKIDPAGNKPLKGAGFRVFDEKGEKVAEGYTDANGELTFSGLRYGKYTYSEFAAPKGYALDKKAYSFRILENGKTIEVTRENTPVIGSITVSKVNAGGEKLAGVSFLLEYSTDGGKTYKPVVYRASTVAATIGGCTSAGLKNGVLITDANGKAVFSGLRVYDTAGNKILYRITETATLEGYSLLTDYAFEGDLTAGSHDVSISVINNPVFKMPAAGTTGVIYAGGGAIALLALSAIATICYIVAKKKKSKNN